MKVELLVTDDAGVPLARIARAELILAFVQWFVETAGQTIKLDPLSGDGGESSDSERFFIQ